VWGRRRAGSGKGVKHVIVQGVEFQCHVFPFPVCVLVQCMAKGNFMTVKANKLKEQNLRVNISSKRKTFFF